MRILDRVLDSISLRAALGLLFALLYPRLSLDSPALAVAFAGGWLAYVAARLLVFTEPETLRRLSTTSTGVLSILAESLFVALTLGFILLWLTGLELVIVPLGAGLIAVLVYLLLHTLLLLGLRTIGGRHLDASRPPRPGRRTFIHAAAFLAEECVLVASLAVTEGARRSTVSAPSTILDLLSAPALGLVLLALCYMPIARLSQATSDRPLAIGEIALVQAGALFVLALTGTLPFL